MDRDSLKEKLEARAKASLHNPASITHEALEAVLNEVLEECKGKQIRERVVMDFAMVRLKIYLKSALTEEDAMLYKQALEAITRAPLVDLGGGKHYGFFCVKNEENAWLGG